MLAFDSDSYGAVCAELLRDAPLNVLGPGQPRAELRDRLRQLTPERLTEGRRLVDRTMAECCLAGLWLLHDFLDDSHRLSQSIETPSGSYWHGIMHRREPDFSNAKYWFRQVGIHPIFDDLARAAAEEAREASHPATDFLRRAPAWDAARFVDLCAAAQRGQAPDDICRRIARREWNLLFDYCFRRSVADSP